MRKYEIFLLEDEVAYYYFGREQVLYQFFVEAVNPVPRLINTIERQLAYITKTIPNFVFDYELKMVDSMSKGFNLTKDVQKLVIYSNGSKAVLKKLDHQLTLISTGNFDAETLMFEHLRKVDKTFVAVDIEGNSIGWLSPVKQAHFI